MSTSQAPGLQVGTVDVGAVPGTSAVPTAAPPLSWTSATDASGWTQASAELRLERSAPGEEPVTQEHRVEGRDSVRVPWPFPPLVPRERALLSVRTRGADGSESAWSEPVAITAAFLADGEWDAASIAQASPGTEAEPFLARGAFEIDGEVASAFLYATALGLYQAQVNGAVVDDQVMKPGWTHYQRRLVHETTDVTALLVPGENVLGLDVAGGWATEEFGFHGGQRRLYAEQPSVAALLVIRYADGREQRVRTGEGWRTGRSPIRSSTIYHGEAYDARLEQPGWSAPGFDDGDWTDAAAGADLPTPEARTSPAVRRIQEVAVAEVVTTPSGRTVLDFGQNLVGRLRIRVRGSAGDVVTLRHAEVLEHGELGIRPLRAARATDTYALAGTGEETWEPEFTFHGFRYAQIDGWPGAFDPADVTAEVIHSDMVRTGWFDSSHQLVNRLHENVVWGLRGNFLSVPTDCPQRDERLGWTGDIQVFAPTASFLYDVRGFLDSWLADVALEQEAADGVVPFVVPMVLGEVRPAAAWGDATTIVPWVLEERFGDVDTLRRHYPWMRAWADVLLGIAGERRLWEGRFQFGDWLDPAAPPDRPAEARTPGDIVASAYLYISTDAVARVAELLGNAADAAEYRALAEEVRAAFLSEYVTPAGRMMSDAHTAYALAIRFDIAPAEQHAALGRRLAELTREGGYRIATGFVGTPIILDALTRTGHLAEAGRLLTQTENPSWLYPVTMGATTIWERWDSMLPDGTINPGQMTSFNHYALGAVADWMHRVLAGLAPAEPAYRTIRVAPSPIDGFDRAEASHLTPYGPASVGWERDGELVTVTAVVPPNAAAVVELPDGSDAFEVGSGTHTWTVDAQAGTASIGPVSLDTSLGELVDDPEAVGVVLDVLDVGAPALADRLREHTVWRDGFSLREGLRYGGDPGVFVELEKRLAELSERRIRG